MNALDRLRVRLAVGVVLVCDRNTYRPARNGVRQSITRVRRSEVRCISPDGDPCDFGVPTRVRDIEWLDDDTVRWPLAATARTTRRDLEGHTVTYRFIGLDGGRTDLSAVPAAPLTEDR